ncbi:MAG: LytTR family DNA-binding domain-containing protein [Bacteroidota bacterium]
METEILLKVIIADDETLARNVVKKYLQDFPQIEIVAECDNGLSALNQINELHPGLVFLDIQMPDLDGLSLLNELQHPPLVIFTTAFNQYAISAFDKNAVDYLLKPFSAERFAQAVQKALDRKSSPGVMAEKIKSIQESLNQVLNADKKYISRILIREKSGYSFLNTLDISWFEADSDYVKIHTKEKVLLKNTSLNELELKLNPEHFVRIHRSTIVNVSFIKGLVPYFNGEYHVMLSTGEKLKLSRSYKDKLKLIIGESL